MEPNLSPGEMANLGFRSGRRRSSGQVGRRSSSISPRSIWIGRRTLVRRQNLAGQAAVVDAKAQFSAADTALRAIEERRDAIVKMAAGGTEPQPAKAPVKGVLQNLHAQVDQQVPAGAILFDVAEMDPIWVKVSVYVGDLDRLAVDRPAGVGGLADPPGVERAGRAAGDRAAHGRSTGRDRPSLLSGRQPRSAPTAGPASRRHPPLEGRRRPAWSSRGRAWFAMPTAEAGFTSMSLRTPTPASASSSIASSDNLAALLHGPKIGAKVVAQGAAELYGAEFGGLK